MDFSLPTLFVVPASNALPTTGSTQNLVAGKFGVFKDDARTIATNGNISSAAYIQFYQGREASIGAILGSKASDKIKASKVKKWYKIVGSGSSVPQITTVGPFVGKCSEDITLTIEGHSSYMDMLSFNGLVRGATIKTPCCDCGADPCDVVDNEAVVDLFIAKLTQLGTAGNGPGALNINTFFTFSKTGSADTARLVITAKTLTVYAQPCDITANILEWDRISFRTFVTRGTDTFVDFYAADSCENVTTVTVTQRSNYNYLTSKEAAQMEIDYYSYQVAAFKHLFATSGYNQYFESYVTNGAVYDMYVIQYDELQQDDSWTANIKEDERVILLFPTTEGATVETMLTTYLGSPEVKTKGTVTVSPLIP